MHNEEHTEIETPTRMAPLNKFIEGIFNIVFSEAVMLGLLMRLAYLQVAVLGWEKSWPMLLALAIALMWSIEGRSKRRFTVKYNEDSGICEVIGDSQSNVTYDAETQTFTMSKKNMPFFGVKIFKVKE